MEEEPQKNPFIEGIKELGRLALLGFSAWIATDIVIEQIVITLFGVNISPEAKIQIITVLGVVLKAIDKWIHEAAKADPDNTNEGFLGVKGLTGF